MTFNHGIGARFYYDSFDFSGYTESVALALSRSLAEYRVLNADGVGRVPGHRDARVALTGGPLDPATNDAIAWAAIGGAGASGAWAFMPYGDVLSRACYLGQSLGENQQRTAGDDVVRLPVAMVNMARCDRGKVLRALAAGGISPGTAVDNGADSANGGAGYLICTANGGALDVVIEESATGVGDWSAICTFTQRTGATATGSEVMVVAEGTAVKRYLRATWTISVTATFFVAFGRR